MVVREVKGGLKMPLARRYPHGGLHN